MAPRKTGVCDKCSKTLYGDEYGACGHKCLSSKMKIIEWVKDYIESTIKDIEADKYSEGQDYYLAGFLGTLLKNIEGKENEPET